ncbi:hypothetical protein BH24PSE2_BH24PSE2_02900 [soil metagenome]
MTRPLKITLGVVVALIVLLAAVMWLAVDNLDQLVTDAIESKGSAATGTQVDADGVHISLRSAEGQIGGLTIDNPSGFKTEHAVRFENIHLALDAGTLLDDTVHVRELRVGSAEVNLEQQGTAKSNLQTLIDNVNASAGPADDTSESTKNVVIDEFILEGAALNVQSELLGAAELELPQIRATDVGDGSAADVLEEILRPILAEALEQAKSQAVDEGRERLEEEAGKRLREMIEERTGG